MKWHQLPPSVADTPSPPLFTYPFCYRPHPLCVAAANEVQRYVSTQQQWQAELSMGKMFGVLIVEKDGQRGFLAAFSGTLGGQTQHEYFVPPVYDLMAPDSYFQTEQARISELNRRVEELRRKITTSSVRQKGVQEVEKARAEMQKAKARRDALRRQLSADQLRERTDEMIRESQFLKAELRRTILFWRAKEAEVEQQNQPLQAEIDALCSERRRRSEELQQWLFRQFSFLNAKGQKKDLTQLFHPFTPPSGAGDCCAPRLLQYAYSASMRPICMAEFWVGRSPTGVLRRAGSYYPACRSKCLPILTHMLQGLAVEPNPLAAENRELEERLRVLFSNEDLAVVSKPEGMLSVPGKEELPSVYSSMKSRFPAATGPLIVHRLDMDTSGLMVVALHEESYHRLQDMFLRRTVKKTYIALLEREMPEGTEGEINLRLRPDVTDRPRQMVDPEHGKRALTRYRVLANQGGHAVVALSPETGRTHQLRVHCAHPLGLNNPIVGDRLYGTEGDRLMLHASQLVFDGHTFTDMPDFIVDTDVSVE